MDTTFLIKRSFLLRAMMAGAPGFICMVPHAADTVERAGQRDTLTVGMRHIAPAYAAGAKFRTQENIDSALAELVAGHLKSELNGVPVSPKESAKVVTSRKADIALAAISDLTPLPKSVATIPTGYSSGPMAIMRTDTDIKAWKDLKGRKVCVSGDGNYVGTIARSYGAVEKVFRAPADSLLALRIGDCDAAVHDSVMLEQLIKLPEWKKFSATLPVGPLAPLVFVVPSDDVRTVTALNKIAREWSSTKRLTQVAEQKVRNIAFEVYLDQDVPDCH